VLPLLYYVDLVQAALVELRIRFAPRNRPLALGFFVSRSAHNVPRAVCPDATYIRVNFPRASHGWDTARFAELLKRFSSVVDGRQVTAIVWGRRDHSHHKFDVSRVFKHCLRVERGLLAPPGAPKTAFIVGDSSIYFDGRESTDLERRLNKLEPGLLPHSAEGKRLLEHILASSLTKYAATSKTAMKPTVRDLLIVGQCTGDQAIIQTEAMKRDNPGLVDLAAKHLLSKEGAFERVFYKPHPKNKTNAADLAYIRERYPAIAIVEDGVSIVPLLEQRPTIATLTSGVGIEAAVRGCPVHTFGVPFYSHWGFTVDHMPCGRRTNRLSAADVFLFMLMEHTRYADPKTGKSARALKAFGLT
jgi:capsular polysaccharide export protein